MWSRKKELERSKISCSNALKCECADKSFRLRTTSHFRESPQCIQPCLLNRQRADSQTVLIQSICRLDVRISNFEIVLFPCEFVDLPLRLASISALITASRWSVEKIGFGILEKLKQFKRNSLLDEQIPFEPARTNGQYRIFCARSSKQLVSEAFESVILSWPNLVTMRQHCRCAERQSARTY